MYTIKSRMVILLIDKVPEPRKPLPQPPGYPHGHYGHSQNLHSSRERQRSSFDVDIERQVDERVERKEPKRRLFDFFRNLI